jgi:hypothetical protein
VGAGAAAGAGVEVGFDIQAPLLGLLGASDLHRPYGSTAGHAAERGSGLTG